MLLTLVAALSGVPLAVPALSSAAEPPQTYAVAGCTVGGQYVGLGGWSASSIPATARVAVDDCAAAGKLGFDVDPVSGAVGRWAFAAPPGTEIDSVRFYGIAGSGDPGARLVFHADDVDTEMTNWLGDFGSLFGEGPVSTSGYDARS